MDVTVGFKKSDEAKTKIVKGFKQSVRSSLLAGLNGPVKLNNTRAREFTQDFESGLSGSLE